MKRLIVCCDGTWNEPEPLGRRRNRITNVLKIARAIKQRDSSGVDQVVLYLQGVGTGVGDRLLGGSTGAGISDNIRRAYQFLAHNYVQGEDQIYLFGFSRGAYTIRSLTGFIDHVNLLLKGRMHLFAHAYKVYQQPVERRNWVGVGDRGELEGAGKPQPFKSSPLPLLFVGLWDTVGALGVPIPGLRRLGRRTFGFHETGLASCVQHGFHALAIHELRRQFAPDIWRDPPLPGQTIQQKWFPGAHSDVGGGGEGTGLSDTSLGWMLEAASSADLEFEASYLESLLEPSWLQDVTVSHRGIYRASRPKVRKFGTAPTESLHDSVLQRLSHPAFGYPSTRAHTRVLGELREADGSSLVLP